MVALFNVPGGLALELSADVSPEIRAQLAGRDHLNVLGLAEDQVEALHPELYVYRQSAQARGIMLESLTLGKDAQGFLKRVFDRKSTVYLLSWAWHISEIDPIVMNPPAGTPPVVLKLRSKETSRFLGDGLLIFPPRKILGGIGLTVQIWESHKATRDFGETLAEIDRTMQTSRLYDGLAVAAMVATAQPALASFSAAAQALMGAISHILRTRGDEPLDVFSGFYGADSPWNRQERFAGHGVEIALNLTSV